MTKRHLIFALILVISFLGNQTAKSATLYVGKEKAYKTIKSALANCQIGDTVIITKGIYKEGNVIIDKSIYLLGENNPVLDGEFNHEVLSVKANHVVIKGLTIQNSGRAVMSDPGGIKVYDADHILIENNTLLNNYFGIYFQYSKNSIAKNNVIIASQKEENKSGNGIHCWKSDSLQIIGNKIEGHRDGIYFEFVTNSVIWRNISKVNLRYGLHFMFSHHNSYITNVFKHNGSGVAVMFTNHVTMLNNTFEENWGDSAYGVLFKELSDCYLEGNKFIRNTTGVFFEGSNRIIITKNLFQANGWGMRLQASCIDNQIIKNNFMGNTFDITTNGSLTLNHFSENYWDKYEGYDLNKDKIGDVPYHPLSLYSVIIEKNPPAMLLYRSFIIDLLDKSERVLPSLTPENFVDKTPSMIPFKI